MVSQFEVYLVSLDPTQVSGIKKTRPALVISPNEMNVTLRTVLVAPKTTTLRNFPSRVKTTFQGKNGDIALILNTTEGKKAIQDSYTIRSSALQHKVSYTTTIAGANATVRALDFLEVNSVMKLQDLHDTIKKTQEVSA